MYKKPSAGPISSMNRLSSCEADAGGAGCSPGDGFHEGHADDRLGLPYAKPDRRLNQEAQAAWGACHGVLLHFNLRAVCSVSA